MHLNQKIFTFVNFYELEVFPEMIVDKFKYISSQYNLIFYQYNWENIEQEYLLPKKEIYENFLFLLINPSYQPSF
jgi:hypothetical protein